MNTKHIEQTHSEEFTSELFDIAYTDRAGDLVTSSLSKPYAEASGTEEVKGDFTSYITELPATLKVLIRRLFSAPAKVFGGKSMSQMFGGVKEAYDWLKERVKGSDGIPKKELPAVEDAAHLAENLRLLDSRDVYSGANLLDGTSLMRLLCSNLAASVTEIKDNNRWVADYTPNNSISKRLSCFANLKVLELGCTIIDIKFVPIMDNNSILEEIRFPHLEEVSEADNGILYKCSALTKAEFPKLKTLYSGWGSNHNYDGLLVQCNAIKRVELPSLVRFENRQSSGSYNCIMYNDAALEELIMPNLSELYHNSGYQHCYCVSLCPSIKKIVLGTLTEFRNVYIVDDKSTELIHIEFGHGTSTEIYLQRWSPTTAITEHLDEFLYNFQTYIADRVADRTGTTALTITLSSAVYAALEAQEGQTILATLTSKNWTVASA